MNKSIQDKLENLKERVSSLQEEIKSESQKLFNESMKEFFELFPSVKSISWNQYTPYFNDGDECRFSVNNDVKINDYDDYDKQDEVPKNAFELASDIVGAIEDNTMLAMFGDHVKVTVTPNGVSTEEYNHD